MIGQAADRGMVHPCQNPVIGEQAGGERGRRGGRRRGQCRGRSRGGGGGCRGGGGGRGGRRAVARRSGQGQLAERGADQRPAGLVAAAQHHRQGDPAGGVFGRCGLAGLGSAGRGRRAGRAVGAGQAGIAGAAGLGSLEAGCALLADGPAIGGGGGPTVGAARIGERCVPGAAGKLIAGAGVAAAGCIALHGAVLPAARPAGIARRGLGRLALIRRASLARAVTPRRPLSSTGRAAVDGGADQGGWDGRRDDLDHGVPGGCADDPADFAGSGQVLPGATQVSCRKRPPSDLACRTRPVGTGQTARSPAILSTSMAAGALGWRMVSGVWRRMASRTSLSRRTMPASLGATPRKFWAAFRRVS